MGSAGHRGEIVCSIGNKSSGPVVAFEFFFTSLVGWPCSLVRWLESVVKGTKSHG